MLAEAGGSDITLDSGDSGINLVDPSDSGLALDDIPLEMGGSAILESLSLGGEPVGRRDLARWQRRRRQGPDAPARAAAQQAAIQTDDDFRLTPLGDGDDDGDSSSQVIALDADMGDLGAGDAGILGADAFAEDARRRRRRSPTTTSGRRRIRREPVRGRRRPRGDAEYSVMNIVGLGSCFVLLLLGVTVSLDMVRNIWSWDQNLALNDSLLDSLLGLFGLS